MDDLASVVSMGTCEWAGGERAGAFEPVGEVILVGEVFARNGIAWQSKAKTQAARMFVGMNVGDQPKWTMDDVVAFVRGIRREQGAREDASFIMQRGVYTHGDTGVIVEEPSAQVVFIDVSETPARKWRDDLIKTAEWLARVMDQKEVIIEFQKGGVVKETIGVEP